MNAYIGEINFVQMVFAIYRVYGLHFDAGSFISISKKDMPSCALPSDEVRTSRKSSRPNGPAWSMFFGHSPHSTRRRLGLGFQGGRPRPGLGIALAQSSEPSNIVGKNRSFCSSVQNCISPGPPSYSQMGTALGLRHSHILVQKSAASVSPTSAAIFDRPR